ncbi:MAG TPA: hypothetical protein VK812_19425 [Candidatus Binatus sp.]|jgi:hypothetical protein|nr:hypothetical protein [Candidatus Binatus sp.]
MGFFLDIYVEYFIRIIFRFFKALGSHEWPLEAASITGTNYRPGGFGCAVAEIRYEYKLDGKLYTGVNGKPFVINRSAETYVEQYSPASQLRVRVKPGTPGLSVVRDQDQYALAQGLRLDN